MTLRFDGDSTVQHTTCHDCGDEYVVVKSFLLDEDGPYAMSVAALHHHEAPEAWIDVIVGTFGQDEVDDGRTTFGCRVGQVEGQAEPAATVVEAAEPYDDNPVFGHKLSREEALAHDRLGDFWVVVDFLLESEPTVNHHLYGHS